MNRGVGRCGSLTLFTSRREEYRRKEKKNKEEEKNKEDAT